MQKGTKTGTPEHPGRLPFTITPPMKAPMTAGRYRLTFPEGRETLLIVPEGLKSGEPVPLLVMFHGARQSAEDVMPFFTDHAKQHRFLLMLPQSVHPTWDLCFGGYGPDFFRLAKALKSVSARFTIDPGHFAFAGFSDGGSYALSLGLTNGDLLSHAIIFSGGFMAAHEKTGKPRVFLSHSPEDQRLNINVCGLRLYRELADKNMDVTFRKFPGGHIIHPDIVEKAMTFFMERTPDR